MWSLLLVLDGIQQHCRGPVMLAPEKPMVVACAKETSRLMMVMSNPHACCSRPSLAAWSRPRAARAARAEEAHGC